MRSGVAALGCSTSMTTPTPQEPSRTTLDPKPLANTSWTRAHKKIEKQTLPQTLYPKSGGRKKALKKTKLATGPCAP